MSRRSDDETRERYDGDLFEGDLFERAAQPALSALDDLEQRAPASLRAAIAELRAAVFEPEPAAPPAADGAAGRELLAYFREETGLTPQGFLRECRLETMAWLLVLTDLSVAEISERVGYLEISSLRRAFKPWSGGLTPHGFRVQVRKLGAAGVLADLSGGVPPGQIFGWYGWFRLERGWLSDLEVEAKVSVLEKVYGLGAPSRHPPAGQRPLARLAAELVKALDTMPWPERRRVTRESIRFSTPDLFDHLCALSRASARDRDRSAEFMVLALDSLEARAALRGEPDPERAALAWTRLAYVRWRQGDLAGAAEALDAAAEQGEPLHDAEDLRQEARRHEAERACLEAGVLWGLGRLDPALERAGQAVELLAGADGDVDLQSRARLLRAALHAYAPRKPDVDALLEELRKLRETLDERRHAAELIELDDLWLRLQAIRGDDAELLRAAAMARALAERLGDDPARCRCLWYEGFAYRKQGDARRAETRWREARLGLLDLDLKAEAAPVTLELTVLGVSSGRVAEAAELARELIAILETSGLAPDTLDAIRLLRGALREDALTLDELKPLRRVVAAVERDVKARRGPAFEL